MPKIATESPRLDRLDFAILRALQRDARLSLAEISAEVGLTTSPCWTRIKRMEEAGVIEGYSVRLNAEKVGLKAPSSSKSHWTATPTKRWNDSDANSN